jgi:tRNA (Thr-GGU) A37 N-methylase
MDAQKKSDKSSHLVHAVGTVRRMQDKAFLEIEKAFRPALAQLKHFGHVFVIWWADRTEQRRPSSGFMSR